MEQTASKERQCPLFTKEKDRPPIRLNGFRKEYYATFEE